jgi:signal transduction histidine kinase
VTLVTAAALALGAGVLLYAVHRDLVATAVEAAGQEVNAASELLQQGTQPASTGTGEVTIVPVDPNEGTVVAPENVGSAEILTPDGQYLVQATPDLVPADTALRTMARLLGFSIPLVLIITAVLTWLAMGRVLRPVEAIRAEFAEITAHDLHRRVPDPRSGDEVSRLAGTMNDTLDQLHRAVSRLRTFTSDASHELRSPLTTLRTRLELAVARPGNADWLPVGAESLRDTEQLQAIVEDLLLLARLDAGQVPGRESFALAGLIHQVARERSGDRVVTVLDTSGFSLVRGGRTAVLRLLSNLVDNAVQHARNEVRVRLTDEAGKVVVEVTDDGDGIAPDDRERIFNRFVRLDDARPRLGHQAGTGLGLAIARDIARAHRGNLTAAEPTPGSRGARIVLTLPQASSRESS